jgi:hypothetical protein
MKTVKRFHGPAAVSNVAATKYTVPTGSKALLRQIRVTNPSGGSVNFTLSIGNDAAGTRLFDARAIAAGGELEWSGYIPLDSAELIQALGSTNNALVLTLGGDEFSA